MQFNDLPIADGTKDAIAAMGYENPTPIQADAIPILLEGRDLIGRAQTGTGKTAAFGIPLINGLREAPSGIMGLILAPTRELAIQVTEVMQDIARASPVKIVPVYGGAGFDKQIRGLRQNAPLVVVACPGRLLDLVQRGEADLGKVRFLILDEADRMLDMGFIHDMRRVRDLVPKKRQTALFSATFDDRMKKLAGDFLYYPEIVEVADQTLATELTDQRFTKVEKSEKKQMLLTLLTNEQPEKAVVFTRTKHLAKRLAQQLNTRGWSSVALQGNMTQGQRERAMAAFRDDKARILVATDVAARGLDVPGISHVFNFDIPMEPEAYVHRVGRTGRNGATGQSFTFVQSDEHTKWRDIKKLAGTEILHHPVEIDAGAKGPDTPVVVGLPQQGRGGGRRKPNRQPGNGPRAAGPRPGGGNGPRRRRNNGGRSHGGQHQAGRNPSRR